MGRELLVVTDDDHLGVSRFLAVGYSQWIRGLIRSRMIRSRVIECGKSVVTPDSRKLI